MGCPVEARSSEPWYVDTIEGATGIGKRHIPDERTKTTLVSDLPQRGTPTLSARGGFHRVGAWLDVTEVPDTVSSRA